MGGVPDQVEGCEPDDKDGKMDTSFMAEPSCIRTLRVTATDSCAGLSILA